MNYFSLTLIFQTECQMLKTLGKEKLKTHKSQEFPFKSRTSFHWKKGRIIHLQFSPPFGKQGTPLWFDNLTQDEIILTSKKVTSSAMMSSP